MRPINILALIVILLTIAAPALLPAAPEPAGPAAYAAGASALDTAPAQSQQSGDTAAVLYRVMGVVLLVWTGLAVFLFRIDRRVAALEKDMRLRE